MQKNKNKDSFYTYKDINFDSQEEVEFFMFLDIALQKGIFIKSFEYQPEKFEICPKKTMQVPYTLKSGKIKYKDKTIYRAHTYTADFKITVDDKFLELYSKTLKLYNKDFYVDVKGTYNSFGGDRLFGIHQKLIYDIFNVQVLKVNPNEFFKMVNLAPKELMYMKNRKEPTLRKHFANIIALEDYDGNTTTHSSINYNNAPSLSNLPKIDLTTL